jgi:hypothetical protein
MPLQYWLAAVIEFFAALRLMADVSAEERSAV